MPGFWFRGSLGVGVPFRGAQPRRALRGGAARIAQSPDHLATRSQRILTPLDQGFKTVYYLTCYDNLEKSPYLGLEKNLGLS
jgi:hypothetical protein